MAPADDPEIVVAVIMDEPRAVARDGGMVSAPVLSRSRKDVAADEDVPTSLPVNPELPAEAKSLDKTVAKTATENTRRPAGKPSTQRENQRAEGS